MVENVYCAVDVMLISFPDRLVLVVVSQETKIEIIDEKEGMNMIGTIIGGLTRIGVRDWNVYIVI
jgi:hypothetical protein